MALKREQVVQAAEKYVCARQDRAAIREYRKLLAENPNDINTLNRIGDLYARHPAHRRGGRLLHPDRRAVHGARVLRQGDRDLQEDHQARPDAAGGLRAARRAATTSRGWSPRRAPSTRCSPTTTSSTTTPASAIAICRKMAELEPENPTLPRQAGRDLSASSSCPRRRWASTGSSPRLMIRHGQVEEAAQVYERGLDLGVKNLDFIGERGAKRCATPTRRQPRRASSPPPSSAIPRPSSIRVRRRAGRVPRRARAAGPR